MGNFLPCGGKYIFSFNTLYKYERDAFTNPAYGHCVTYMPFFIGLSEERQQSLSNRGSCCSGSNGGAIVPGTFPLSENNAKYDSEALIRRSSGANVTVSQAVREF